MSSDLALLMPQFDPFTFSVTSVAERSVGGKVSSPPRPTLTRRFSPYSQFASLPSVSKKSITPSPLLHSLADTSSSFKPFQLPVTSNPSLPKISQPPTAQVTPSVPTVSPTTQLTSVVDPQIRSITPRAPQAGRSIAHNSFRPRVAAADRLFGWDTPFGIRHKAQLAESLPPPLAEAALMSIRGALAPNSKTTYAAGILRWNQFCDKYNIGEEDRMPASYALLCAFIAEYKGRQSGNTIKGWLSGLRSFHLVNHAPWSGDDEWVHFARTSANKEGTEHKRPLRAPVSIEHLSCLRRALDLSNPFHAAVWAVALCTFWGCRRLGEITVSTAAAFDERYHVLRSTSYVALLSFHTANTNHSYSGSRFVSCAMEPFPCTSESHGPRPPSKKVPSSLSQPATTSSAHVQPYETTSMSTLMSRQRLLCSHTTHHLAAPKTCSSTIFSPSSPQSGSPHTSRTFWGIASGLVVPLNSYWLEFHPRSSLPSEDGHHWPSSYTGAVWRRFYR